MNLTFHTLPLFKKAARYAKFSPYLDDGFNERLKLVRVQRPSHVSEEEFQLACDGLVSIHEQDREIHVANEQSWVCD